MINSSSTHARLAQAVELKAKTDWFQATAARMTSQRFVEDRPKQAPDYFVLSYLCGINTVMGKVSMLLVLAFDFYEYK